MLDSDQMRFLVIGEKFDFAFPKSIKVKTTAKTLNRKDGQQLELSLFEFVPEDEFNETEKAVAWYLEGQKRLFFWYRNRSRQDYAIQGWRKHKIYPDFIFTATASEGKDDYDQVYVVETKGLHLIGSEDTDYKRKMFSICTKEAESKSWTELGLAMKDKVLRLEVLAEDEWQAKLNAMLQQ
jgi:type III restriction enzyme